MERKVIGYDFMRKSILNHNLENCPFFFASPTHTLMGVGVEQGLHQVIPFEQLAEQAMKLLQQSKQSEADNPILFGLIPFSEHHPTQFVIPQHLYVSGSTGISGCTSTSESPWAANTNKQVKSKATLVSPPSGEQYRQSVEEALVRFTNSELSKVVLSRAIEVATDEDIDQQGLMQNLLAVNSHGYTFSAHLNNGNQFLGASPELLVAKQGRHVISNPLAGSRPRSPHHDKNEQHRQSLLNSAKDLHEHRLVVEEVERVMSHYCHDLYTPMMPSVIETNAMMHLSTRLEGQVSEANVGVLQIAAELHPTPAVCGFPRQSAYQAIRELESFERGYFTGMVGWCDSRGNGEWVVTIRCAEVQKRLMKIYAGAGIVTQSHPQSELDETGAKMGTILSAAGIELKDMLLA